MQCKPDALPGQLERDLAPAYLVAGDETLLVEEACDAIIAAATRAGFDERSVLHAESGFNWNDVLQDAASLSLFATRRLVDVRVPTARFDRQASEVLRAYLAQPAEDTILLVRASGLDANQRKSAWFKAFEQAGVVVLAWPVRAAELPRWIAARLARVDLTLEPDAITYFCERIEGNLLAAVQEISKLNLADLPEPITVQALVDALEDASHYDTFELLDAVFAGNVARVARMVAGLQQEGVAPFAILGALTAQLRRYAAGDWLPPQRRQLLERLFTRLGVRDGVDRVLAECALVDQQGKGQLLGDAWLSLENLLVRLAGGRLPSLQQQLPYLTRP